jgi:hypothetical protein
MIVGFVGFIGSGKGTAGEYLQKKYGFKPISFASHVKDVTAVMFGWDRKLLEGDTEESRLFREQPDSFWSSKLGKDFTPRWALQLMGTEVGRDIFDKNFWVHYLEKNIVEGENYVVTDVRFKNEIEWLQSKGGKIFEVERDLPPHWYNVAKLAYNGNYKAEKFMREQVGIHESEWAWVGCKTDGLIYNYADVEAFEFHIDEALKNKGVLL